MSCRVTRLKKRTLGFEPEPTRLLRVSGQLTVWTVAPGWPQVLNVSCVAQWQGLIYSSVRGGSVLRAPGSPQEPSLSISRTFSGLAQLPWAISTQPQASWSYIVFCSTSCDRRGTLATPWPQATHSGNAGVSVSRGLRSQHRPCRWSPRYIQPVFSPRWSPYY